jgi:hypothetical protein
MNRFSMPKSMNINMGLDPCSIGPLTCGVHPEDVANDDDDDNNNNNNNNNNHLNTLFAAAANKGRATFKGAFRPSNNYDVVAATKLRIADFQSRGWLSQHETRKYMEILDTAPTERGNKDRLEEFVRSDLIKELDELERKMTGGSSARTMNQTITRPLGDASSKLNIRRKSEVIVSANEVAGKIGDKQIEELFVETCFFARLGFVQPPSCLKCAYRESIKGDTANSKCSKWVVWRRDANYIIHPNYLTENSLLVQCHAARELLAGKSVESHQWDATKKALLSPR